jgi:hypothetical protein
MRRYDKKKNMENANKAFQKRMNESAFSWDGKYEGEEDIEEGIFLGNDMENSEEEISEEITNITTDVNDKTQFFSDEDGQMVTDGPSVG